MSAVEAQAQRMAEIAGQARMQMPPAAAFQASDSQTIVANRDFLISLTRQVVQVFYDTLLEYAPTAEVFEPGERPMREQTLADWWRRTAEGPHDDDYFAWMAMVGLVHVVRRVTNPMFLSMADLLAETVSREAHTALATADADALTLAYRRLTAAVTAVVAHSYDHSFSNEDALFEIAGMPAALLHRLRDQEATEALANARLALGRARAEDQ